MLSFVLKRAPNPLASILNFNTVPGGVPSIFIFEVINPGPRFASPTPTPPFSSSHHHQEGRTPYLTSSPKTFPPRPTTNQAEKKTG